MTEQSDLYRVFYESDYKCEGSTIVIFGASGDLSKRKLMPSLYNLYIKKLLPAGTNILGVARAFRNDDELRDNVAEALRENDNYDEKLVGEFVKNIYDIQGDVNDKNVFKTIKQKIEELESGNNNKCGNRLFYLSVPPETYLTIVNNLYDAGLNKKVDDTSWTRIIIEKPFGHDLKSAKELNKTICRKFKEEQIYRIDHYLGKETVQNMLVFRFGNGIFEPIWNRNFIDHVQITSAETLGIGSRGGYYEKSGALRDMVQNHLLQLVAYTAMEPPVTFDADKFRNEKMKVFETIKIYNKDEITDNVIRGQYGKGDINNENVPAYKEEKNVEHGSCVETFTAMKLFIQNWRWAGVPFYIRTGKRLKQKVTEINLVFKKTPHVIFQTLGEKYLHSNVLSIEIQPEEGISLKIAAKFPGQGMEIKSVKMEFTYNNAFNVTSIDSYERLLMDCIAGDQTLYSRRDEVEALWGIVQPVIDYWKDCSNSPVEEYPSGSWGPGRSDELLKRDGREWLIMH